MVEQTSVGLYQRRYLSDFSYQDQSAVWLTSFHKRRASILTLLSDCDNFIQNGGAQTALTDCKMPCAGNANESCGAGQRLNVFWSGKAPPPAPVTTPRVGDWIALGCVTDNGPERTLPVGKTVSPVTVQTCTAACFNGGYPIAGAEYADECCKWSIYF